MASLSGVMANDHLVISDSYPGENLVSCQELKLDDLLFGENIHSHQLSGSGEFNSGSSIISISHIHCYINSQHQAM